MIRHLKKGTHIALTNLQTKEGIITTTYVQAAQKLGLTDNKLKNLHKKCGNVIMYQEWIITLNCQVLRQRKEYVYPPINTIEVLQRRIENLKAKQQKKEL